MTIIISILLGMVGGVMFGALWRAEQLEALSKAYAQAIEERDMERQIRDTFRTKQRQNWVN